MVTQYPWKEKTEMCMIGFGDIAVPERKLKLRIVFPFVLWYNTHVPVRDLSSGRYIHLRMRRGKERNLNHRKELNYE